MTCHKLHAGDGYQYLTRQVANGDLGIGAGNPIVEYYYAEGNPAGRWAGSGIADLGMSGIVTEEHMLALFGEGLRPDANAIIADRLAAGATFDQALGAARLGRRFAQYDNDVPLIAALKKTYAAFEAANNRRASVEERRELKEATAIELMTGGRTDIPQPAQAAVRKYIVDELGRARQPVTGFDLVFSPVKSVSLLWALGGHDIRAIVEEVHEQAWQQALAYGEREAAFTRVGPGGIAQIPTSGFVAVTFQHRDSRAGDPDLHTHVTISNRVMGEDGKWRTLDGQQLYRVAVSMSEAYNSAVEQGLVERLGTRFEEVTRGAGKRSVREIVGMPADWIRGFSRRRTQVEVGYDVLVRDYVRRYGQSPPRSVQRRLAQQATLENRPGKVELKTLVEQIGDWTRHARDLIPGVDIRAVIAACLRRPPEPPIAPVDLAEVASAVVDRVSQDRSTWTVYHLRAEAQRQLRPVDFPTLGERMAAVDTVAQLGLDTDSVLLDIESTATPQLLQRPDGESVFRRRGSQRHTSEEILAAEARLVDDALTDRGPTVSRFARDQAIRRFEKTSGKKLNPGQRDLVAHFVSGGRALAVAIGPPGTGKSTAMAAVREAWETTGGRVLGYAPSAAAASVLGDELGVRADTLHSLTTARQNGAKIDVQAGDMLLVDEAGMAGTRTLDEIRELAEERGAVLRLIGDYRQLAAVEAGGALRLIYHDAGGVELSEVLRFKNPAEAEAVLAFRVGDRSAIGFYQANNRLYGGVRAAALDRLFLDWQGDVDAGRTAIMISDSADVARELSARAQTERRAAGLVEADGVALHDGTVAGVGDRIVTRLNKRRLALFAGRDFVKNGDLWQVEKRHKNGSLRVRHVRHGGRVTLPASYVADWVELGYAATIHRAQGLTVDISRSFLSHAATRLAALVALSRGTDGNYAYLDTEQILNPDEPELLPGDLYYRNRETTLAEQALEQILDREGAELSATEELRDAMEAPYRLSTAIPQYAYALHVHRGPDADDAAEQWVRAGVPDLADSVLADEAWPELARVLNEANDAGADPVELLRRRAAKREFATDARDPSRSDAKVLYYRIVVDMPTPRAHPDRPDMLPGWVATPPPQADLDPEDPEYTELGHWLQGRAQEIADRVYLLGERAVEDKPDWADPLGEPPTDAIGRDWWIRRAGHVAAYRERWHIPGNETEMLPEAKGEQARARAWVLRYLADTGRSPSTPAAPSPASVFARRATRVRDQLAALRSKLARPTNPDPTQPGSDPAAATTTTADPETTNTSSPTPGPDDEPEHDPGPEL